MSESKLHGDKQNGIEFRYQEGELDEVVMYCDGKCVLHAERMDDKCFWFGLYPKNVDARFHCGSVNNRSHVHLFGEDVEHEPK